MRARARFEGYADVFAVTARDLEERGFGTQPQFRAVLIGKLAEGRD